MTPRQYRRAVEQLGLTQEQFAFALRKGTRTVYRWSAGMGPIPWEVILVLRYWLKTGIPPDEIDLEDD